MIKGPLYPPTTGTIRADVKICKNGADAIKSGAAGNLRLVLEGSKFVAEQTTLAHLD